MKRFFLHGFALAAVLAVGCSSSDSSSGTQAAAGSGGSKPTPNPNTCVQPGDKPNSIGVGAPCTPGGEECKQYKLLFCLADVGQEEWFCTQLGCKFDNECGDGAVCHKEGSSSACVPAKCGTTGSGNGGAAGAAGASGAGGNGGTSSAGAAGTFAAGTAGAGGQ